MSRLCSRAGFLVLARAVGRKVLHSTALVPGPVLRPLLRTGYDAAVLVREAYEWVERSLVATPLFLAQCEAHGEGVSVDRMPYMTGLCRIRLGDRVRIAGLINILPSSRQPAPLLEIGSNVYIGHDCMFGLAERISIGDFTAIGEGTYIADTSGHSHRRLDVPIWEDPADAGDVAPVVIEDNVHIGRNCIILKGVRIGARSVVGASSVVRSDIAPDSFVAGNPARVSGWRPGVARAAAPRAERANSGAG